jgi:hypothetical protein
MYQVGDLIHYRGDDLLFENIDEARAHIDEKFTKYYELPVGIWQRREGVDSCIPLIEIFMQGEYFVKE